MKRKIVFRINRLAGILALLCAIVAHAPADTISVTNTNDSGPGSLRQGLGDANDGDTIDATGISGVITLISGELLVDKSITISGPGPRNLAIDANAMNRVFYIGAGRTVAMSGLTITNGNVAVIMDNGGGIYNDHAILTLDNCHVTGNLAGFGAGVFSDGESGAAMVDLQNSTVSNNVAIFRAAASTTPGLVRALPRWKLPTARSVVTRHQEMVALSTMMGRLAAGHCKSQTAL